MYSSRIIGRLREIESLSSRVSQGETLLSLVGPSGIGKTRLAQRFARERSEGAVFCDLSSARSNEDLVETMRQRLAIPKEALSGPRPVERLGVWLSRRSPGVFVLDNIEQLLPVASEAILLWHDVAKRHLFILTTQHSEGLPESSVFPVGALGLPAEGAASEEEVLASEAGALFLARAREHDPELSFPPALAAQIVRRLEGIPLAIELAACRLGVLSPSELQERIGQRFLLLGDPNRGESRHSTLWRALEWSFSFLSPRDQEALCQAAAFAGGFTLASAEAVLRLSGGASVLDAIHSLYQKSFLRRERQSDQTYRFFMYESIKEFSREKLSPSELAKSLSQHASFFLQKAIDYGEQIASPRAREGATSFVLEYDNINTAISRSYQGLFDVDPQKVLQAALGLHSFLWSRGLASATVRALESAREFAIAKRQDAILLTILNELIFPSRVMGQKEASEWALQEGLALARAQNDLGGEADFLFKLGSLGKVEGRDEEGDRSHQRAREIFHELKMHRGEGLVLSCLGITALRFGDFALAHQHFTESIRLLEGRGDPRQIGSVFLRLSGLYLDQIKPQEALDTLEKALAYFREIEAHAFESMCLGNASSAYILLQQREKARESIARGIVLAQESDDMHNYAILLWISAMLSLEEGDLSEAESLLFEAVPIMNNFSQPRSQGLNSVALSYVEALRGQPDKCRAYLEEARGFFAKHEGVSSRHMLSIGERLLALRELQLLAKEDGHDARGSLRLLFDEMAMLSKVENVEVQTALLILKRQVALLETALNSWCLHKEGEWFRPPMMQKVSLKNRPLLMRLLAALISQHMAHPGERLSSEALFSCGWPKERISPRSAQNRLHVALSTMRKTGLDPILLYDRDERQEGYRFNPDIPIQLIAE